MIEKKYLDYMQACYKEIWDYIRSKDNTVDHDKMGLFFGKTVSPYKFWLDDHKSAEVVNVPSLLEALTKKYVLRNSIMASLDDRSTFLSKNLIFRIVSLTVEMAIFEYR